VVVDGVSNSGRFSRLGGPIVISTSLIFSPGIFIPTVTTGGTSMRKYTGRQWKFYQMCKGLVGKNGTVPLGHFVCRKNDFLYVLKQKEKDDLYGGTGWNRCIQTDHKDVIPGLVCMIISAGTYRAVFHTSSIAQILLPHKNTYPSSAFPLGQLILYPH